MQKRNTGLVITAVAGLALISFNSCKNGSDEKTTTTTTDTSLSDTKRIDSLTSQKKSSIEFKFFSLTDNLPAPFSIVNDIYSFQVSYKQDLLNPCDKQENYLSVFKKEVNYGVYGLDLGYICFYGKNQELLNYYATTKKLAEQLNIGKIFDQFADRFKNNSSNKDSVVAIVDNVFNETDGYLKKNDRFLAASHILAGALIELNYLSLNLLKDVKKTPDNAKLFEKVYNENLYIYHLVKLYEEFKDKDSQELLANMKTYQKEYGNIIKSAADLTPENIAKATTLVNDLRNKLVK